MKTRIGIIGIGLVFLIGLGILLYPVLSDLYYKRESAKIIEEYEAERNRDKKDYTALWEAAEAYNAELAKSANPLSVSDDERERIASLLNPLGNGMMGYIEIEKIDVHLPIYQGTEEKNLQSGVGWWLGTSLPTGGESTHCVITAHTGLIKAKMFTDIDQLEVGDTFNLTVLDRVMTYEVDKIQITEPDEYSPLRIEEGMDYVTLYTCYPYGKNTHRLLVRGHRIETLELAESSSWRIRIGYITILIFLFLLLLLILIKVSKRRKHL